MCFVLLFVYNNEKQFQKFEIFQTVGGLPSVQEDFSELPPNQRRKKLQAKLDELTAKISQVKLS